jgi:hypothetical protein
MLQELFDAVRTACRRTAGRSRFVKIDRGRISKYAKTLSPESTAAPVLDPSAHFFGEPPETAAFILTLDSINFGSGWFPHFQKIPGKSGYFTVATRLTEYFRRNGPLTAVSLQTLTPEGCADIFGQPRGGPVDELMAHFAKALNDLGALLHTEYGGDPLALIGAAAESAENLAGILTRMPYFRDVAEYDGAPVPFYKRAQLTAADLALAFNHQVPGRFHDLDRLTIFADNLVPHVLRLDGILVYDPALARRIDQGELIPPGSPEEVEIRALAVDAVERIGDELRATGRKVSSMDLDYLLWNRGQQPEYKQAKPRHRTRTVYY